MQFALSLSKEVAFTGRPIFTQEGVAWIVMSVDIHPMRTQRPERTFYADRPL